MRDVYTDFGIVDLKGTTSAESTAAAANTIDFGKAASEAAVTKWAIAICPYSTVVGEATFEIKEGEDKDTLTTTQTVVFSNFVAGEQKAITFPRRHKRYMTITAKGKITCKFSCGLEQGV